MRVASGGSEEDSKEDVLLPQSSTIQKTLSKTQNAITLTTQILCRRHKYIENILKKIETPKIVNDADGDDELGNTSKVTLYDFFEFLNDFFFPGIPAHYPLKKKLLLAKTSSPSGVYWDLLQVLLSVVACGLYVAETYSSTYEDQQIYGTSELLFTQFFLVDFLFNWFTAPDWYGFFGSPLTIVDVLTIVPVFIGLALQDTGNANLAIFRFVRILRLARILRSFRLLGGISGSRRQVITLILTLLSLIFLAAGIMQLMENDVKMSSFDYDCKYVNENTNWEPSCSENMPVGNSTCCSDFICEAIYGRYDPPGQPSSVRCFNRSFFRCFFYVIVTFCGIGYGDPGNTPSYDYSRVVVIFFILSIMTIVPMQLDQLNRLISMGSTYRKPYIPTDDSEHIIICGHVNDRDKLERFFKEFFHPDRITDTDLKAVVMGTVEPAESITSLLISGFFNDKVQFIVGNCLNTSDLYIARADIGACIYVCICIVL